MAEYPTTQNALLYETTHFFNDSSLNAQKTPLLILMQAEGIVGWNKFLFILF